MGIFRSLGGSVTVKLTSADISGLLSTIYTAGIPIHNVCQVDALTVTIDLGRQHFSELRSLTKSRGDDMKLQHRRGIYWWGKQLLRRPIMVLLLICMFLAAFYLPGRIFFFRVEGNRSVPTRLIVEQTLKNGVGFGVSRKDVRSETVKNDLLASIPELEWAGINTYGCLAVISVRERMAPEETTQSLGVGSIVAARDGLITEYTVTKGNGLCKVGQAVKAGEVLISGYTDCGISIQATRAQGEIYAITQRDLEAIIPSDYHVQGAKSGSEKKYSLIIGKKRINFYKDSGISQGSCDKMYVEYYLTLPGGFTLPVALAVEECIFYETESISLYQDTASTILTDYAKSYLSKQMVSGTVVGESEILGQWENGFTMYGEYVCHESIGQLQSEEIITNHGKSD